MNISVMDKVELDQKGRRSKYRWLCAEIEKIKGTGDWLVIDELESFHEAELLKASAYGYFPGISIHTRSYDKDGRLNPSVSFKLD